MEPVKTQRMIMAHEMATLAPCGFLLSVGSSSAASRMRETTVSMPDIPMSQMMVKIFARPNRMKKMPKILPGGAGATSGARRER